MKEGTFYLAPNLSILLVWSPRFFKALEKRYWTVMQDRPEATEYMRHEYGQWEVAKEAAYLQIQRLFQLTATTPVVGDQIMRSARQGGGILPDLCIDKRWLFSWDDSEELQMVYELSSWQIEELEEYQEGDFVDEED